MGQERCFYTRVREEAQLHGGTKPLDLLYPNIFRQENQIVYLEVVQPSVGGVPQGAAGPDKVDKDEQHPVGMSKGRSHQGNTEEGGRSDIDTG